MFRTSYILVFLLLSACATAPVERPDEILNSASLKEIENRPQSLINVADKLYLEENYAASFMMYFKAWEENKSSDSQLDILAQMGQANSKLRLGQYQAALINYQQLLKNGFSSPQLQLGMAEAFFGLGKIEEAQLLMTSLNDSEFNSVHFFTLKAVLKELSLEPEEARVNYEKAIALQQNSSSQQNKNNNMVNLALSYALTGDFDTSFALLNSIEVDEKQLALVHAIKGDMAKAEEIITQYFFRKGYGRAEVEQNLAFYKKLPELSQSERVRAVVMGKITE